MLANATQNVPVRQITLRERAEYLALRLVAGAVGVLPRSVARAVGAGIGAVAWTLLGRLRRVGMRNLEMAFPEKTEAEREAILRGVYRSLGWQLAEFCQMRGIRRRGRRSLFAMRGWSIIWRREAKGKGVLVLTGHLGAWELSSFYHSLMGYPMWMVIRRLDNPLVDAFVNRIRCLHGNRVIHKDDFARGLLTAMQRGRRWGS